MFKKLYRKIKLIQKWKSRHRLFAWPEYGKWVNDIKTDRTHFVPYTDKPFVRQPQDPKIFAYYLTQFHSIPENDNAYGKGYTEWQNVASCAPHYVGHYQPKIPYDLGFYNLLMPGVMERQVEMAKAYGIYGFCFYYYWFSGKKVLEKPLEYWLSHKEIDFHYHFCWANENWSRRWDGSDNEVFLKQEIKDDDAVQFFNDILPYIKDARYEKIGNKPILMIYRPDVFPIDTFLNFVSEINRLAKEVGFDGFFLTGANFGGFNEPLRWGLDGLTEFPPHGNVTGNCIERRSCNRLIPETDFLILDMHDYIKEKAYIVDYSYPVFKCCFPSWDNTPRKAWSNGRCFQMSEGDFADWLKGIIGWTRHHNPADRQYVYINAWNEWGEGAVLEPTLRYGYKYLNIVKEVLEGL